MAKWRDIKQGKVTSKEEEVNTSSNTLPIAPLSARLKAFLTDTFLITTPIFYLVVYLIMGSGEAFAQDRTTGWLLILFMHSIVIIFFWAVKNQTPGMKAYDVKIVNHDQQRPNFIQVLIRYVATLLSVVSLILMLIPFFRKDKRTFQDIFSHTYVVND
ncbi:RDD family protein [Candidatus Marinarcus aquaticus]|uniref:RDD domain-containing protein n=1 Tax=Candidatus Marinarcus aquaticus TaxID=2044504 RepID=A0A4Q0XR62_9BACT|nr:RDD family protein [Candidatus Marinarcus aquaticus]RXJ58202.1 hypothetical protein CRV04_06755 [Candidatus Marinarcus aquaticus]